MAKLQVIGDAVEYGGVVVAKLKSEKEVPATVLADFLERLMRRAYP